MRSAASGYGVRRRSDWRRTIDGRSHEGNDKGAGRAPEPPLAVHLDAAGFLAADGEGRSVTECRRDDVVFAQGDVADAVFFVRHGKIVLSVRTATGRETTVAILGDGIFFGEGCLAGQNLRTATATAVTDGTLVRIAKARAKRLLRDEPGFSEAFMSHLLSRGMPIESALVDRLFDPSEKRLARALLRLARAHDGASTDANATIDPQTLAEMTGTTRARVREMLRRLRRLGFIEVRDGLHVRSSRVQVIVRE